MNKKLFFIVVAFILLAGAGVGTYIGYDRGDEDEEDAAVTAQQMDQARATHFGFLSLQNAPDLVEEFGIVWDRPHPGPFNANSIGYADYDWENIDDYVDDVQAKGIVTLATIWPFEQEDQMKCHANQAEAKGAFREFPNRLYLPCDLAALKSMVSAMVERYDGDGKEDYKKLRYPIRYWEVSNEPEMQGPELTFFQGSPEEYAALLTEISAAIRAADSEAKVVQGGAAGAGAKTWDFWNTMFSTENIADAFDIANIHSLSGSADLYVEEFKALMEDHGISGKPIWVTEAQFGDQVHQPPPPPGQAPSAPQQTTQETLVRDGVLLAFAHGADKIFWTTYRAPRGGGDRLAQEMAEVAFVNGDGSERPSHRWFEEYAEKLNDFTSLSEQEGELIFTTPSGEVRYANPE